MKEEAPKATKASITSLYNRVAGQYDQLGPRTFAIFGQLLAEEVQIKTGMRILDIGTGRGAILIPMEQNLHGRGLAAGIDLAWEMVRQTHQEIARTSLRSTAALACMDGESLGLTDASFDVLLCGFAFFFLDPHRALPEWRRVLRPGGRLAISVAERGDPRWAWYEEHLVTFHRRHHLPLYSGNRGVGERNRPAEIAAVLRDHGFNGVQVKVHEVLIQYPDVATWWQAKFTHGARYPLEKMPADLLAAFQEEVMLRAGQMELSERWRLACILA